MKKLLFIIPSLICFTFFTTSSQTKTISNKITFCVKGNVGHCVPSANSLGFICVIDASGIKDCK